MERRLDSLRRPASCRASRACSTFEQQDAIYFNLEDISTDESGSSRLAELSELDDSRSSSHDESCCGDLAQELEAPVGFGDLRPSGANEARHEGGHVHYELLPRFQLRRIQKVFRTLRLTAALSLARFFHAFRSVSTKDVQR